MRLSVSTEITAPPEVVFATALDIPRWPEFIRAIKSVEIVKPGGADGTGTVFRETRIMFGREATEEMTIAELVTPRRFVTTAFSHGTDYRAEHDFEGLPGGGTRLTLSFEGRPRTLSARLMSPVAHLLKRTIERQLAADLVDVKREAERQARPS